MGNSTCAYRLDVHAKQAKRQQNKKSNDNSNFSIRPWTQSQPFTVGTKTTEGKIRAYLWTSIRIEWNPLHVKRWMRDHIHRNAVSWFRFLVFFFHSSDVESFVTCLKFTKRKPNQFQGKSTLCLTFYSCWGFYLSSSPSRRWFGWEYTAAAANSRQTAIYGNGMHLFCCHCFAHHYTFSIVIRA